MKVNMNIAKVMCIVCALAVSVSALVGCGSSSGSAANNTPAASNGAAKVKIGTLATEDILPMWVAEAEGIFAECGVDASVEVFQSATELIAGVTSGSVDYAMTDPMVTASMFASGTDVQVKWITLGATAAQGRFGIMTADDSITSLSDLAGVPIGVGSNTILEYVMDTLMTGAGVPEGDIAKEELQKLPVRYQAMAGKQVKAAALPGSLLALGEANGCRVVADDTTGDNISQSVMIVRSDFLKANPEAEAALEKAWDKAVAKINANPEGYRELLVKKASLPDAIASTYKISEYPSCQLPTQEMIDRVLVWMDGKGYLSTKVSYDAATGTFSK